MPFAAAAGDPRGRQVAGIVAARLAQSPRLRLVDRQRLDAILAQCGLQPDDSMAFADLPMAAGLGRLVGVRWLVVGDVAADGDRTIIQARCIDVASHQIVPGAALWDRGPDWPGMADQLGRLLTARLTGGYDAASPETAAAGGREPLEVRLDRTAENGRLPVYLRGDSLRVRIRVPEPGWLLVLGVGARDVYRLFPVGTQSGHAGAGWLDLPGPDYRDHGYDPRGFELCDDRPAVEEVQVFFSRRPIPIRPAAGLTPTAYHDGFLPELTKRLDDLDPSWQTGSASYFYAVDDPDALSRLPSPTEVDDPPSATDVAVNGAVGAASLGADPAAARDLALLDAQRRAVEQALGLMLRSETIVDRLQLVSDTIDARVAPGLVRGTEVVEESVRDGLYLVRINATVSAQPLLEQLRDQAALREFYEDLDRPRIACALQADDTGSVATRLLERLAERGLDVVALPLGGPGEDLDAATAAAGCGAAVVIVGTARGVVSGAYGPALRTVGEIELRAVRTADRQLLLAARDSLVLPQPAGDIQLACRRTIAALTDALFDSPTSPGLVERLIARWLALPTRFVLNLVAAGPEQVDRLLAALQPPPPTLARIDLAQPEAYRRPVALFTQAVAREIAPARTVLDLATPLRPGRALEHLRRLLAEQGWRVIGITGNEVTATAVSR